MGMGLAICRSIARAHGGDLEATPAAPGGTRMIFSLPLQG
jgi:signal transduction histidine kinase